MKFNRWPHSTPYEVTPRKLSAIVRKQRLERESAPLFADMIAEHQPTVAEVVEQRTDAYARWQQESRNNRAASWRKARARLAKYGDNVRPVIRQLWNDAPYPADPVYLLDFLHGIEVGRIDINRPPWHLTPEEIAAGRASIERYLAAQRVTNPSTEISR